METERPADAGSGDSLTRQAWHKDATQPEPQGHMRGKAGHRQVDTKMIGWVLLATAALFLLVLGLFNLLMSLEWFMGLPASMRLAISSALTTLIGVGILIPLLLRQRRLMRLVILENTERRRSQEDAKVLREEVDSRSQLQRELEESRRSLRTLIDNLPGFAYRCKNDRDWTMTLCSDGVRDMCGVAPDDLISGRLTFGGNLIHPGDRDRVWEAVQQALAGEGTYELKYRVVHRGTSEVRVCLERGAGVFGPDGELVALEGFVWDITEQERATNAVQEREAMLRALFECPDVNMGILRLDGDAARMEMCNRRGAEYFGKSVSEVEGKSLSELGYPDKAVSKTTAWFRSICESGKAETTEYWSSGSDGQRLWFQSTVSAIKGERDAPPRVAMVAIDITKLKDVERLLDGILRSSSQGVVALRAIRGEGGRITDFEWLLTNPEGERLLGKSHAELHGRRMLEAMPQWKDEGLFDAYAAVAESGEKFVRRMRHESGGQFTWTDVTAVKLGDGVAVSLADVTAQVRAEKRSTALGRMLDQSPNEVYVADASTLRFVEANRSALANTGYSPEELKDMPLGELWDGSRIAEFLAAAPELVSGRRESWSMRGYHRRKDGTSYPVDASVQYGEYAGHQVYMAVVMDLTERVETERELREAKERLELALKGAGLGVWDWDIGSHETQFDERYAGMLGYSLEELQDVRRRWADICHPDDYAHARAQLDDHISGKSPFYACEVRLLTKSGEYKWILDRGQVVEWDDEGRPVRAAGIHIDIDAQKRVQVYQQEIGRLRESQRQIVENAGLIEFHISRDKRITWISPVVERILGYSPSELVGSEFGRLEHPDSKGDAFGMFERLLKTGGVERAETRVMAKDGSWKWLSTTLSVVDGGATGTQMFGGIASDVTSRREAEAALRMSEERLDLAVGGAELGTWDWDLVTGHRYYSDRWFGMLGWTRADAADADGFFDSLLHPDDYAFAKGAWDEHLLRGKSVYNAEVRLRTKDGTYKWILDRGQVVERDSSGRALRAAGTHLDIDAQKQVQQYLVELDQVRERFRQLIENTNQIEYYIDLSGNFLYVSPAADRAMGIDSAAMTGKHFSEVIHPEDLPAVEEAMRTILRSGTGLRGLEYRIRYGDGSYQWHSSSKSLTRGPDGEPTGFGGITSDISARKQAEEASELLRGQLQQAQKMEAVGRLVGGVAHDFNNLLTPILGRSELLLRREGMPRTVLQEIEVIREAASRAGEVTRQLLAFSRKQVLQTHVLPLNSVVREFTGMLSRLIGEDVRLELDLAPGSGAVRGDRSQLQQVLMNLAVNARDAMPDGGTLRISTRHYTADSGPLRGRQVEELAVSDTGCGIPGEHISSVFDPFFTTKEREKGTGLGLSTAYGIIQQHGGTISVQSEVGIGSIFRVQLPSCGEAPSVPGEEAEPGPRESRRGRILVVEDDSLVRMLVNDSLSDEGHEVYTAAGPDEALRSLPGLGRIDLLVTDVVMPGMKGPELYQRVLGARPGIRVVYMSGYTDDVLEKMGISVNGETQASFIQKPFTIEELSAAVREALVHG